MREVRNGPELSLSWDYGDEGTAVQAAGLLELLVRQNTTRDNSLISIGDLGNYCYQFVTVTVFFYV